MEENAIFNVESLRDGLENLKKLYGEFGFIDFVAERRVVHLAAGVERLQESSMTSVWGSLEDEVWNDVPTG